MNWEKREDEIEDMMRKDDCFICESCLKQIVEKEKIMIADAVRDYAKTLWFWEKIFITIERSNLFRAINTLLANKGYKSIEE